MKTETDRAAETLRAVNASRNGCNHYLKHIFGQIYTDGVQEVCEAAGCYWFLDAIVLWQPEARKDPDLRDFQVWTLRKQPDGSAIATCATSKHIVAGMKVIQQVFEWTDLPVPELCFWLENEVLLLPSER